MANIKKIKIGSTEYDIRDASVSSQISGAIGLLDGSANIATVADSVITIYDKVNETDGVISSGSTLVTTWNAAKIAAADAAVAEAARSYTDQQIAGVPKIHYTLEAKGDPSSTKEFNSSRTVYLEAATAQGSDAYNEFICIDRGSSYAAAERYAWEKIGDTRINLDGKVDKLTTSGTKVYSHTGATQGEIAVDSTNGGTSGSSSLITSGAVYSGLSGKQGTISNVNNVGNVSAADANNKITLKNVKQTSGQIGLTDTNSAIVYNVSGVDAQVESAKTYADGEMAKLKTVSAGYHSHSVTASGNVKVYTPSTKYMKATASGGAVTLDSTQFLTGLGTANTAHLVTSSIAVNGMVTNVTTAEKTAYTAAYDSSNECLNLTAVTFNAVNAVSKNSAAITYATGAATAAGTGEGIMLAAGYSNAPKQAAAVSAFTQPTITLAQENSTATGRVAFVASVSSATTESITVTGDAASAGTHSHTVNKTGE